MDKKYCMIVGYKKGCCNIQNKETIVQSQLQVGLKPYLCNFLTLVTLYEFPELLSNVYGLKCDLDSMTDGSNEPIHSAIRNPW
jgi:hypothetical protein